MKSSPGVSDVLPTDPTESAALNPGPALVDPECAAFELLDDDRERLLTMRVHDATRFEWTVSLPLPLHGRRRYTIEVELELPTNAVVRGNPWDQIQTFVRFEERARPPLLMEPTMDALRRAAISLERMLARATEGFARHAATAATWTRGDKDGDSYPFLAIWLETALRAVGQTRRDLATPRPGDTEEITRERMLVDEYASLRVLETLSEADRILTTVTLEEATPVVDRVRARIQAAMTDEVADRRARGFPTPMEPSEDALDAYVARTAQLKRHFEEVLFLDRESYQLDERVEQLMASFAALFAGFSAFLLQLGFAERGLSPSVGLGTRLLAIALLTGACYMARDRLKELGRSWLTGKVYRFHAQRVSQYRMPEGRSRSSEVIASSREWCNQSTWSQPDALNPQSGASLVRTRVRYQQKGVLRSPRASTPGKPSRVRHIFRYDLSPLLPRLADDVRRVPYVASDGAIRFADVPRRYLVPVSLRVDSAGTTYKQAATLVLEKRGIVRLMPGIDSDVLACE